MESILKCVCGRSIKVWADSFLGMHATATAQDWAIIGKEGGEYISSLCPKCNYATKEIAAITEGQAQRRVCQDD